MVEASVHYGHGCSKQLPYLKGILTRLLFPFPALTDVVTSCSAVAMSWQSVQQEAWAAAGQRGCSKERGAEREGATARGC